MPDHLADVLGRFVQRSLYSHGQLAELSGVPKNTITNWLGGRVKRPHRWQQLLRIAAALDLTAAETDALLQAAHHAPLAQLRAEAAPAERPLLEHWPPPPPSPFQAIADLPYFVGRETEMEALRRALLEQRVVALCSLQGMGGVGKTALAAHVAYHLRDAFPDGVLWARLDTSDTMSLLALLAGTYGMDVSRYPTVDSRSTAVRGLLAHKRALLVLDNAESSDQVAPLLPPSTGKCAVLITTRRDLAVSDGWPRVEIRPFSPQSDDALALFAHFLGPQAIRPQREHLLEIAALVGHLPLALALVAARLARGMDAAAMREALDQKRSRLGALQRENRSVRASFAVSYAALSPEQQRFFMQLGVFGGDNWDAAAAAAVTETAVAEAETRLQQLQQLSLIQAARPGRYRLHPLLRDFAGEKLAEIGGVTAASERMISYYVSMITEAAANADGAALSPARFAAEMSNLTATLATAAEQQRGGWLARGVRAFFELFYEQGYLPTLSPYISLALRTAETGDDLENQSVLHLLRGRLLRWRGQNDREAYEQALALARRAEDGDLIVNALKELGSWGWRANDFDAAETYYLQGIAIARESGNRVRLAELLSNLGLIHHHRGAYERAIPCYEESLAVSGETGHVRSQVVVLQNLGCLYADMGDFTQARSFFAEGEAVGLAHDCLTAVMGLLGDWGYRALKHDRLEEATCCFRDSLKLARRLNHTISICVRLADLGEAARRRNDRRQAGDYLQEALTLADRRQLRQWRPVVQIRLARLALDRDDSVEAQMLAEEVAAQQALLHAEYREEFQALRRALQEA